MHIKIFLFGGHKNFWTKIHWPNHINKKTAEILASNEWRRMRSTSLTDKYWPIFPNQLGFTKHACSGVSNSSWPHQLEATRLLCPWDFPGEKTGAGCHFFHQGSSQLRDQTQVSCIDRQIFFTTSITWEVGEVIYKLPGLTRPLGKKNSGERHVQVRENLWQWKLASTEGFLSAKNWEKCNRYHHI